jgi:hypothetical protein
MTRLLGFRVAPFGGKLHLKPYMLLSQAERMMRSVLD